MKKSIVTIVLVLAIMFVVTSQMAGDNIEENTQCPYFDKSGLIEWNDLHRWCPPFLARAMTQICRGKYNNPPEAYNGNQGRRKRSIIDECCWHCCSAKYLKDNYCNDSRADNRKLYVPSIPNEGTEIYSVN